jgi:adenylate cyclase
LLYLFENFALDTDRRELRRGDAVVAVEPKVFDLLAYLIKNRQRVVSRDDLIARVWDGRIVSESALARGINVARGVIGDSGDAQRLIRTLPRKGLRFVGVVQEEQTPPALAAQAAPEPEKSTPTLPLPERSSIAVLPLDNLSGDREQDYFCDGITEDIITELSRFSELFVIARNSSFQYKGKATDVRQVGQELGVGYVVEGSIRRGGGRFRVSVQLVDAITGTHRWAERYDRQIEDVFAFQDEVARTIVANLAAHVNRAEMERTLNKPPASWEAYDYYLRAAHIQVSYYSSFHGPELYEARRLLEQSLTIDPNYARAYARLSWTHFAAWVNPLDADYLSPVALDRAHELARKAVQLDPNLPDAHAAFGQTLGRKGEHEAAIIAFEKALTLNPNFTDWRLAQALAYGGEPERAIAAIERHMRLDPFYVAIAPIWLGIARYLLKQYSLALLPLQECVARAPNLRNGHLWLAATYAQMGRIEAARAEAAEVLRIEPAWTNHGIGVRIHVFKHPEDAEHLFDGLAKAGLPD